jgi:signal transduction histidine kinase
MLKRLPIEAGHSLEWFALLRMVLALITLVVLLALGLPYGGGAAAIVGFVLVPWSVALVWFTRDHPELQLHPLVAPVDFAILAAVEWAAPETYSLVRFAALFLIAVHAHFQGERRGLAVTVVAVAILAVPSALHSGGPSGDQLALYETVFALSALATAFMVGRLRTEESASRLRARGVSRRTIKAETEVRRRLSETIHDGPVQELIGLDMVLSAAGSAIEHGDTDRSAELIGEARGLVGRNVQVLRDEIVDLGPYAFEELSFETAIENCIESWKRRYEFEVTLTLEPLKLAPECAGELFRITQEAVVNAGRHSGADTVAIALRAVGEEVELRVVDNGSGFDGDGMLDTPEPGHLGLASMRERAELLGGGITIDSSSLGTRVLVRAPLDAAPERI